MELLRTVEALRAWRARMAGQGRPVGFVPTMGYLHQGHQTLMKRCREEGLCLVVSIFVNPLQFGPGEDFEKYPRDEARDLALIAEVDPEAAVFLPAVLDMYPRGFATSVEVAGVTAPLCGRSRPGHFKGVTTVVARLLGLVQPTRAYFGRKDYQQLMTISTMVRDLAMPYEVVGVPTVREGDGLAMSSRNSYLLPDQRLAARCLSAGLRRADQAWREGERVAARLVQIIAASIDAEPLARVDYIEVLDAETLGEAQPDRPMVAALAVYLGRARLIDNHVLGEPLPLLS